MKKRIVLFLIICLLAGLVAESLYAKPSYAQPYDQSECRETFNIKCSESGNIRTETNVIVADKTQRLSVMSMPLRALQIAQVDLHREALRIFSLFTDDIQRQGFILDLSSIKEEYKGSYMVITGIFKKPPPKGL